MNNRKQHHDEEESQRIFDDWLIGETNEKPERCAALGCNTTDQTGPLFKAPGEQEAYCTSHYTHPPKGNNQ